MATPADLLSIAFVNGLGTASALFVFEEFIKPAVKKHRERITQGIRNGAKFTEEQIRYLNGLNREDKQWNSQK